MAADLKTKLNQCIMANCTGQVEASFENPALLIWKCNKCGFNYGINSDRPAFLKDWKQLTRAQVLEIHNKQFRKQKKRGQS